MGDEIQEYFGEGGEQMRKFNVGAKIRLIDTNIFVDYRDGVATIVRLIHDRHESKGITFDAEIRWEDENDPDLISRASFDNMMPASSCVAGRNL